MCLLRSPEASSLCDDHGDDADDEDDYDNGFANNVNANRSVEIIAQEGEGAPVIMSVHTLVNSNPPLFPTKIATMMRIICKFDW